MSMSVFATGRLEGVVNAELGLQRDVAEADSGIAQQQVSRWRKSMSACGRVGYLI
jgi:hypothetical protein